MYINIAQGYFITALQLFYIPLHIIVVINVLFWGHDVAGPNADVVEDGTCCYDLTF